MPTDNIKKEDSNIMKNLSEKYNLQNADFLSNYRNQQDTKIIIDNNILIQHFFQKRQYKIYHNEEKKIEILYDFVGYSFFGFDFTYDNANIRNYLTINFKRHLSYTFCIQIDLPLIISSDDNHEEIKNEIKNNIKFYLNLLESISKSENNIILKNLILLLKNIEIVFPEFEKFNYFYRKHLYFISVDQKTKTNLLPSYFYINFLQNFNEILIPLLDNNIQY